MLHFHFFPSPTGPLYTHFIHTCRHAEMSYITPMEKASVLAKNVLETQYPKQTTYSQFCLSSTNPTSREYLQLSASAQHLPAQKPDCMALCTQQTGCLVSSCSQCDIRTSRSEPWSHGSHTPSELAVFGNSYRQTVSEPELYNI